MKVLRNARVHVRHAKRRFRTATIQIETAVMFYLGGTVAAAILLNTNLL